MHDEDNESVLDVTLLALSSSLGNTIPESVLDVTLLALSSSLGKHYTFICVSLSR